MIIMTEENKETEITNKEPVKDEVTPPPSVQEAEIEAAKTAEKPAEEPVKEEEPKEAEAPVNEAKPTVDELEIIEQEIAKLKAGDEKTAEEIQAQISKIKELTEGLSKQQAEVAKEKEEIAQTRKGYATIPATESSSAQPVKKDAQEMYNDMTDEQRYAQFERQFRK